MNSSLLRDAVLKICMKYPSWMLQERFCEKPASLSEERAPGEGKRGAVLAGDFVDTALVTAAFKTGGQKRFDDGFGELNACHARSEAENVGIVMPAG